MGKTLKKETLQEVPVRVGKVKRGRNSLGRKSGKYKDDFMDELDAEQFDAYVELERWLDDEFN